jgi:hypothetical protein
MNIDRPAPIKTNLADRIASAKATPNKTGKSFGAAFDQALSKPTPATTPQKMDNGTPQPSSTSPEKVTPAKRNSNEDHLETIKFRLKTGYYNSKNMDDALTEKLTGFFDELA